MNERRKLKEEESHKARQLDGMLLLKDREEAQKAEAARIAEKKTVSNYLSTNYKDQIDQKLTDMSMKVIIFLG